MTYSPEDVKNLKKETGCSLSLCKQACDYAEAHEGCEPRGYLKAVHFGTNRGESFEDAVRRWSYL